MVRAAVFFATFVLFSAGCAEDPTTSSDLGVGPPDLAAPSSLTLFAPGAAPRTLDAYYSFYVTPLPDEGPSGTFLIVTAVDPSFDCAHPSGAVDALSFLFRERGVGAIVDSIAARRGPDFGATIGGNVAGRLTRDDDCYVGYELDGGVVDVGSGGYVGGTLHFDDGELVLDGPFGAGHCSALDIIVGG